MSTILAQLNGSWYLAAFAPHINGCNLSTYKLPEMDKEGFHKWQNGIYVRSHVPLDGITFFPTLRYSGYRTFPWAWQVGCEEPKIKCIIDQSEISGGGLQATLARMQSLIDDGWAWDQREGGCKLLHIDELEKIEGPPPDGIF